MEIMLDLNLLEIILPLKITDINLIKNFPKNAARGGAPPPLPPPGYATDWL